VILGFQAVEEEKLRVHHIAREEDHDHDDEIISTHLILDRTFDPQKLQNQLQLLAQQQEIYRIRGLLQYRINQCG